MTTEKPSTPFNPRVLLAAFGLALALSPFRANAACTPITVPGDFATIQGAINSLSTSLSSDECILVSSGNYPEQVTIGGFTMNNFRITISSAPGAAVTVNPGGGTAAFVLNNASVTIRGIRISPTSSISYGIVASSANVEIAHVNVEGGFNITQAGISITSESYVSNSSVTLQNAKGLILTGFGSSVQFSTFTNANASMQAVFVVGASSVTIGRSYLWNPTGEAFQIANSSKVKVSFSTITSNGSSAYALYINGGSSHTFTQNYIANASGGAANLLDSGYNKLVQNVFWSNGTGSTALRLSATGPDKAIYNQITGCVVTNTNGYAGVISFGADHNDVVSSTFSTNLAGYRGLEINTVSSTTIRRSFFSSQVAGSYALYVAFSSGVTIDQSTMTNQNAFGLYVDVSSDIKVLGSYAQGAPGAYVRASTNTLFAGDRFTAWNVSAPGLQIAGENVGFSLFSSTVSGLTSGKAIELNSYNTGVLAFNSSLITGAGTGFEISPQSAGAILSISTMTFANLSGSGTAIDFTGGTFISTFTGVTFADGTVNSNVNGAALTGTARITMLDYFGPRSGPTFENDPAGRVDWNGAPGITPVPYTNISAGGFAANWNSSLPGGTVYYLELSTDAFATVNRYNSLTNLNFVYSGLFPSTTYQVRVGAALAGPFTNLGTVATTSGGSSISFNTFGSFGSPSGAVIASGNGQNEAGMSVAVDRYTGGGPYTYVIFGSTPGATASRNNGHDTAGVVGIVRYGPSGTVISSRTLAIDTDGKMAVDNAGNVYVGEMDKSIVDASRWISKYSPSLSLMNSVQVSSSVVGSFGMLASNGTSVYALIEDRNVDEVQIIAYDTDLVQLAAANPYSLGAGKPARAYGIGGDESGFGYVLLSSDTPNAAVHVVKYDISSVATLDAQNHVGDFVLPVTTQQDAQLAVSQGKFFIAFTNPAGNTAFVHKYDTAGNYTGVASTITNLSGPFGRTKIAIESNNDSVFVAGTVPGGDVGDYFVMKYDANTLNFISSGTFNSPTYLADQALGMALGDSDEVFVTGASSNTIGNANAATVRFMLAGGGSGSCGSPLISDGEFAAISTHSLTVGWNRHPACPPGTIFTLLLSSNSFSSVASTVTTGSGYFTFSGLDQSTLYRVAVSTTGTLAGSTQLGPVATYSTGTLSITGIISYAGFQPDGFKIEAFTNAGFTGLPVSSQAVPGTGPYYLPVPANTYYLRAFTDVLGDGVFRSWVDKSTLGPVAISASSATGQSFVLSVDTVAPASAVGMNAAPGAGQVYLNWTAPTTNANGSFLEDLRGYILQRSTSATFNPFFGSPSNPISSGSLNFTDFAPVPGVTNSYRVIAVDFGQNQSAPSAPASVAPGGTQSGGVISGRISSHTVTTSGSFRVRLSTSPQGPFILESNQYDFSFTGLSTGTYYLKGFRDLNEDGFQGSFEPAGTGGGLHNNPYPIFISGTNSPYMVVNVCDRSVLPVGSPQSATLLASGCPAVDAGPNRYTNPLAFEVGGGGVAVSTQVSISMTKINSGSALFDSRLVVLGPSGQIVASNSSPNGAAVTFTPTEAGIYVVEPTSDQQFSTGAYTVTMNAGASGTSSEGISGDVSYTGSQTGPIIVRFFNNSSFAGIPLATQTVAAADGTVAALPYTRLNLPAGTYTVDAYRDTSGTGYNPAYQAYGRCFGGTTVVLPGGSIVPAVNCTLADPVGTSAGTSVIEGSLAYTGGQSGPVRVLLQPIGSTTAVRFASTAFAANTPYSFTALAAGTFMLKAYVDTNSNFVPDPSEPVVTSSATGITVNASSTRSGLNFKICDRNPIVPGVSVTFSLSSACPAPDREGAFMKLYTFYGTRTQPVTITAEAIGFTDAYLNLYDPDGNRIAFDDDSGGSYNAKITEYVLPVDGVYTVAASPYYSDISGSIELTVTQSGGSVGSIAGDVIYNGTQGGAIQVALFSSTTFSSATFIDGRILTSTRTFLFSGLFSGTTYYLGAFVDVNSNDNPDPGENSGIFGIGSTPTPIYLFAGQNVTGANIQIESSTSTAGASHVTGSVFYYGARTGQVILEFWPGAQFTGTPTAVRNIPTGIIESTATYDVVLPGGVNYFLRAFVDSNNDFIPNPDEPRGVYSPTGQGVEAVYVPTGQIVSNINITLNEPGVSTSGVIGGEGSATVSPAALSPGQPATIFVTYTVGPNGIAQNGTVGFSAPNGFPYPGNYSFGSSVTVTNDGGAVLSAVQYAGASAFVTKTNVGTMASGTKITFEWSNVYIPCAVGVQTITVSAVKTAGAPAPLFGGSPSVSIAAGQPFFFQPRNPYFSLRQDELSEPQILEARDSCGNVVPVVAASTVQMHSAKWDPGASNFIPDPDVTLSATEEGVPTADLDLLFAAGASSRTFYVLGTSTGYHNLQMFFDLGNPSTYYYGLSVVPANALTNVKVSSSPSGQALSSATIAAGASGIINSAFVNFSLGDPQQSWRLLFSSVPNRPDVPPTPVWERWGYGQPNPSEIVWDGRYSPWINGGARVPNGLYYGRVELGGGGVRDDSLRVTVALPQFSGRAYDSSTLPNPPLTGALLRVYGPSGYFTATTGSDGRYVLPGLGAGAYFVNMTRANYVDGAIDMTLNAAGSATSFLSRTSGLLISSNATGGLDLFVSRSPRLIVVPSLYPSTTTATVDQWGSLQVRASTSSQQGSTIYGPMRLKAGTTTFDDGGQWDPGTQQFVERTLLGFNLPVGTYTVVGDLSGYSRSTGSIYVGPEGARLDLTPFVPKATITGQVNLGVGNALTYGLPVGVTAIALSTMTATSNISGGAFINSGSTYAIYSLNGFDAGDYILRANAQGFSATAPLPVTVVGTNTATSANFPNFGLGASIAGTITAVGADDGTQIFVNAWSPGSFNFGSTIVYTSAGAAPYELKGLDVGATYQLYANVESNNGGNHIDYALTFPAGGFPIKAISPDPAMNFTVTPASGVLVGTILLSAGASDFHNVTLNGITIASLRPSDVGRGFVEVSTTLPNFACGGVTGTSSIPVNGYCMSGAFAVSSATFRVTGINTETIDIRFLHSTSGQSARHLVSIVNGSTFTLVSDLSGQTYSIGGSVINQITDPLFNTNEKVVANARLFAPLGYPAGLSSTTARVTAVRQEIDSYGVAISTVFNPITSRVGFIMASGTFTIPNTPNGVYLVRTVDLRACATCPIVAPSVGRIVTVANAAISSVTLTLSAGYSVAGTLSLDGGILDAGVFDLQVLNRRQEVVRSTTVYLGDVALGQTAGSVDYAFPNLPAGEFYTMVVKGKSLPIRYAGRPIKFPDPALSPNGLQSNLTQQNVLLQRAAYIIGRLKDNATGERIGATNATLLAPNFAIAATANPWIEGGFVAAVSSMSGRPIEGDGYFRVGPLFPDVSYDLRLAQSTWDPNFLGSGSQNYAPVTLSGLKPTLGEIRDVGTVGLGQGQAVTGVVRSTTTGLVLGNIKVTARPSFGGDSLVVQSFTNSEGRYSLWVSSLVSNQFNLTAAPRDGNQASDGRYYGTVVLSNVNLQTQTSANFLLTPLTVVVTGQLVVGDAATGGALSYPFGDKRGFPAGAINMHLAGSVSDNPLGDIEATTDERGFFSVPGLSTGIYTLHATSLGYAVYNATVQVVGSTFHIFTGSNTRTNDLPGRVLTLARGATVSGRILKSDGSAPNSSEVVGVAAANFAAGEFVVGSVETDPVAKTVSAYTISGFKVGISYSIVLLSGSNGKEVSFPAEGAGVIFSAAESTTTKTINLSYLPTALDCLGTAKALNPARSRFSVQIDCLKPLRQETAADDDLTLLLAVSTFTKAGAALTAPNGAGVIGDRVLSSDRRRLTANYTLSASETRFSMRVRASAAEVDPRTGVNFAIDKVFDFFAGLDAHADGRVTNIDGGSIGMQPSTQDELLGLDERSRIDLPPGAFAEGSDSLSEAAAVANATTTVNVSMSKGRDQQLAKALSIAAVGYAPMALEAPDSPNAFPAEMWGAMSLYRTQASTTQVGGANPISAFYSIFLPAGIRHQLKKRADLTLSYSLATSTATADDMIQVWFYNAVLGRFVLENTNRRLDTVNKTVTVSVDHFSTFVVLDSPPVLVSDVNFGGTDIAVANFPNPADCITHSNIARNSTLFGLGGVHDPFVGTMIRTSVPPGINAELKFNIYTVAGEKIRTISNGMQTAGKTYYSPWNCRNDGGGTVASGVYIGEAIFGGRRKFFKIAIIKGSGL